MRHLLFLFTLFILSCSGINTSDFNELKFEERSNEIFLEYRREIAVSHVFNQDSLIINFIVSDEWIDKESNQLFVSLFIFLNDQLDLIKYIDTRITFVKNVDLNYAFVLDEVSLKLNREMFLKNIKFLEMVKFIFNEFSSHEVGLLSFYNENLKLFYPKLEKSGSFWDFVLAYSQGCTDSDKKETFYLRAIYSVLLMENAEHKSGVDIEKYKKLFYFCDDFKEEEIISRDKIISDYIKIFNDSNYYENFINDTTSFEGVMI